MADQLSLPGSPRTPTLTSYDDEPDLPGSPRDTRTPGFPHDTLTPGYSHDIRTPGTAGLGIEGAYGSSPIDSQYAYDQNSSPPSESAQTRTDIISPVFSLIPSSPIENELYSPFTPQSVTSEPSFQKLEVASAITPNPFQFTPQQYTVGGPPTTNRPVRPTHIHIQIPNSDLTTHKEAGKRRGHTYQRSSIHINAGMIPEPARRAPLQLPSALPTPTRKEIHKSMTTDQKARLTWCMCHFFTAAYVQWSAHGSLSMTALSRLLFFDAAGAITCVLVEVMGNFEVWRSSSIKHPFG